VKRIDQRGPAFSSPRSNYPFDLQVANTSDTAHEDTRRHYEKKGPNKQSRCTRHERVFADGGIEWLHHYCQPGVVQ
jgi:hypothetical protein